MKKPWTIQTWICVGLLFSLTSCVENVVKGDHDCPSSLTAVDMSASPDTDKESQRSPENICVWDTCQLDEDCGSNEKCYPAKDYDWGRCFWEDQFSCETDEDCGAGTGMVCGQADQNTVAFYEGLGDRQCRYGCNDEDDCRLIEGTRCVTSKWDETWMICADGCNEDADCITEETPLLRCLEDHSREYNTCQEYCTTNEECIEAKGEDARCSSKNVCLTGNQCVDFAECAVGEYCDSYAGCNLCKVDGDCRGPPHNDGNVCVDGRCVHCRDDTDCDHNHPVCTEHGYCAQCSDDSHCSEFHRCEVDRCNFMGCQSNDDCQVIATDRGMGDVKEHMVCVIMGEGQWSTGQCKVGCDSSNACEDLRPLLPHWLSNDHRGQPKPNWDELHGACAPPCVGGTCQNH